MGEPFIKLYKKMLDWEWYRDTNTFRVFMHCLLKANWKDNKFMGCDVPRGSFVSSYPKIAEQTNLSIKNVRTAIDHLKSTGELAVKTTSKFSVITVKKYNSYQATDTQSGSQSADNRQSDGSQSATIEEYKNIRIIDNNSHVGESASIVLGIYHNVRLTQEELQELMRQYPDDYKDMIDNLSTYMRSKGKLYDDHFATMMRWKHEDQEKAKQKPETKRRNLIEEIRNA